MKKKCDDNTTDTEIKHEISVLFSWCATDDETTKAITRS